MKKMLPVIILAGGLAERMRPLTDMIPKSMLEVAGKPFLYHQINLLKEKGISHVVLCLGHRGEMIEEYIIKNHGFGIEVRCSYDGEKLLGTGGAVKKASEYVEGSFFILYGDSYLDIDYGAVGDAFTDSPKKALMTVYKNNNQFDKSNVVFGNGMIHKYTKKQQLSDMKYIDYGLSVMKQSTLKSYQVGGKFDLAEMYEQLADQEELAGYEVFNRFYEIGSFEGLKELEAKLIREGI